MHWNWLDTRNSLHSNATLDMDDDNVYECEYCTLFLFINLFIYWVHTIANTCLGLIYSKRKANVEKESTRFMIVFVFYWEKLLENSADICKIFTRCFLFCCWARFVWACPGKGINRPFYIEEIYLQTSVSILSINNCRTTKFIELIQLLRFSCRWTWFVVCIGCVRLVQKAPDEGARKSSKPISNCLLESSNLTQE